MESPVIRVVIADNHPAIVAGVNHIFSSHTTISVVSTAQSASELLSVLKNVACDVLIADYSMQGGKHGDGLRLFSLIRRLYPQLNIVIFTALENPIVARSVLELGCKCVVSKCDSPDYLAMAVHAAFSGGRHVSSRISSGLQNVMQKTDGVSKTEIGMALLSSREFEVVRLFASGLRVSEIAEQLHRSKKTISAQKLSAMEKLGARSDVDLFRFAAGTGL